MKTNKAQRDQFRHLVSNGEGIAGKGFCDFADDIDELESRLSASIRLREILDQDLEAYKTLVHRQAELLERSKEFAENCLDVLDDTFSSSAANFLKDLEALGEE
jgi:hypothetical protein